MNIQTSTLYRNYSYGNNTDSSSFGGGSYDYSQYEQTLLQYISQVKMQMQSLQQGSPAYQQAAAYLNTAMGYLHMVDPQMEMNPDLAGSGWDPLGTGSNPPANGMGVDSGSDQAPQFPIDYQDSTHIVTDDRFLSEG
jgi:hypothetical protein